MEPLAIDHLWERDAYDETGRYLGRIEAVGMGRDRVPRRVGVRSGRARVLRFFMLTGARLDGERLVVAPVEPSLLVLPGGPG